tara:strand:+ start:182 stop:898 length:717 start_codon:yes stop_codon:yes gene_type:complete
MKKKRSAGDNIKVGNSSWTFSGNVAQNFDNHISKSVPYYNWSHQLGLNISDFFLKNNSNVYDIGCSTGSFLGLLSKRHPKKNIKYYGIDEIKNMIIWAKKKNKNKKINFLNKNILDYKLKKSEFITSFYTMQFIPPAKRQIIFNKIFKSLNWGGGFLLFEKVRAPDARFQDMMSLIYNDYKLDQGYNAKEIIEKSRSLKGVMEPFSSKANFEMLKRAGFKDSMSVFKFVCFEGFLAIK